MGLLAALTGLVGGCSSSSADFARADAVVTSLPLSSVGAVSSCVHGRVGGFGSGASCQVTVSGAGAVAGVGEVLTQHGFARSGSSTYTRGGGQDYVQAILGPLSNGATYTDVAAQTRRADADGALLTVSVHL